jgi:hypothetical protein
MAIVLRSSCSTAGTGPGESPLSRRKALAPGTFVLPEGGEVSLVSRNAAAIVCRRLSQVPRRSLAMHGGKYFDREPLGVRTWIDLKRLAAAMTDAGVCSLKRALPANRCPRLHGLAATHAAIGNDRRATSMRTNAVDGKILRPDDMGACPQKDVARLVAFARRLGNRRLGGLNGGPNASRNAPSSSGVCPTVGRFGARTPLAQQFRGRPQLGRHSVTHTLLRFVTPPAELAATVEVFHLFSSTRAVSSPPKAFVSRSPGHARVRHVCRRAERLWWRRR